MGTIPLAANPPPQSNDATEPASGLICGFGLLEWALQATGKSPMTEQFYLSGVTFFTLGYGDIVPHTAAARTVSVIEAGCGIGFIAVVIGYRPVLYQLFSRREAHVIQLDARAGSPPTATTMLSRHAEADSLDKLDDLLREWEVWGSDLLESHLSYPMLVFYRSQHDNQSWLAALSAVMDSCALILVGVEEMKPLRVRSSWKWRDRFRSTSRYDGGDRLPPADYLRMEGILAKAGLQWKGGPERPTLSYAKNTGSLPQASPRKDMRDSPVSPGLRCH